MTVESRRALGSRYELVERLGGGAMGEVWRTWDRTGETWVAAKRLRPELTRDPQIVTRFVQERSILVGLDHPNILRVRDLVVEGEDLAIVMDLVDGPDLGTLLRSSGTLTPRQAVAVTCGVLDALEAAHQQHCLHRDVKPDNVLVPDAEDLGGVLLSDFGIARLAQESTVQATGLLGTPGYMPPELFAQGSFSAASDVYAAGVMLYELLAGRTPFSGSGTAHTVGYRHVHAEPPVLDLPAALWHALATMLAKDPARRLTAAATARALRDLPDEVLDGPALPVQATPESWVDAPVAPAGGPIRVQPGTDLDPGATNLHARPAVEQTFAAPGQLESLVGRHVAPAGEDAGQDAGETYLGREAPQHLAPRLERVVASVPDKPRRRWPWVVAVLVVLAVVAGLLLLTGVLGGGSGSQEQARGTSSEGQVDASTQAVDYPTGLRSELSATYDEAGTIDLTWDLDTARTPLGGDFLLVLPGAGGATTGCPQADWAGGIGSSTLDIQSGLNIPCGWRLTPGTIDGSTSLEATVYLDLSDAEQADPTDALQAWLDAVDATTQDALDSIDTGYDFAVQRLQGISVRVTSVVRNKPTVQVPYTVLPVWRAGDAETTALFRSPLDDPPTGALEDVAGGGIDQVKVNSCRAVAVQGVELLADTLEPSCFVEVSVGELYDDATFSITGSGS